MTIKTAESQQFQDTFLQALAVGQEPDIKCLKNWGKRHNSMARALSFKSKGPRFKSRAQDLSGVVCISTTLTMISQVQATLMYL